VRGLLIDTAAATGERWDPGTRYRLDPAVALRPEPFGALAYHYGSRRLTFLRDHLLVDVVRALGGYPSADAAVADLVPERRRPAFTKALAGLAASKFIRAEPPAEPGER
jgi:putative mycofactocin binding protein MftB